MNRCSMEERRSCAKLVLWCIDVSWSFPKRYSVVMRSIFYLSRAISFCVGACLARQSLLDIVFHA